MVAATLGAALLTGPSTAGAAPGPVRATVANKVRVNESPAGIAVRARAWAALPARDVVLIGSTAPNVEVVVRRGGVELFRTTAATHPRRPGEPRQLGDTVAAVRLPLPAGASEVCAQSGGEYTGFSPGSRCATVQARVDRAAPRLKVLRARPVDAVRTIVELRLSDDLRVAGLEVRSGAGPWESAGLAPITGRSRQGKTIGGWYYLDHTGGVATISLTVRGRAGRIVRLRAVDGAGRVATASLQQPCLPGVAQLCA